MHTESNHLFPSLLTTVEKANKDVLLELLKNAKVSVGHWKGRLISVPGYRGHITFSKYFSRVEELYQETVQPMQRRQRQYDNDSSSNIDVMPIKGPRSGFINLALLPITLPARLIGDAICWASTPYPEISEEEEKQVRATLEWRKKVDTEFDHLFKFSQKDIEYRAAKSCRWTIIKCWDSFLDTQSAYKNIHIHDKRTLSNMVETRKKKIALQPALEATRTVKEEAQEILPTLGLLGSLALLTYAKYRTN